MKTNKSSHYSTVIASLGALMAAAFLTHPASAQTIDTWVGTTATWTTPGNWGTGVVPVTTDTISFASTAGLAMPTAPSVQVAEVIFTNSGWIINGASNDLTVHPVTTGGTSVDMTGVVGSDTISPALNLNTNSVIALNTSGTLVLIHGLENGNNITGTNGTIVFSANHSYSGVYSAVGNNSIGLGATNALGTTSKITWNSSGSIFNAASTAVVFSNSIAVTGSVTFSASAGVATLTENGIISGASGAVVMGGSGTVILGGANTYGGGTMVNAGSLLVQGSLSSSGAVTVAAGATLGTGKAAGAASLGTLNVSLLALTGTTAGSKLLFTLGSSGTSDRYVSGGAVSITGSGQISLVLTMDSGATLSGNYTLLSWSSGDVAASQVSLAGSDAVITTAISNGTYVLQDTGSSLILAAVPEPPTWALFGCGLAVAGLGWKRRHREPAGN